MPWLLHLCPHCLTLQATDAAFRPAFTLCTRLSTDTLASIACLGRCSCCTISLPCKLQNGLLDMASHLVLAAGCLRLLVRPTACLSLVLLLLLRVACWARQWQPQPPSGALLLEATATAGSATARTDCNSALLHQRRRARSSVTVLEYQQNVREPCMCKAQAEHAHEYQHCRQLSGIGLT